MERKCLKPTSNRKHLPLIEFFGITAPEETRSLLLLSHPTHNALNQLRLLALRWTDTEGLKTDFKMKLGMAKKLTEKISQK
jgi:hypothetical protein